MIKKKEEDIKDSSICFFDRFIEASSKCDKKTAKDNLAVFFASPEEIKIYIKPPFAKFEDRAWDKWAESLKFIKDFHSINVLRKSANVLLLLIRQLF